MNKRQSPLITAADVKRKMTQPNVLIVDARGGADAEDRYRAGHLQGALFLSLETELSSIGPDAARGGRHPLPDPYTFGALLGKTGISPSTDLIVYDDKAGANAAARFWWMMRAAGHANVQVIDGGLSAIQEALLPLSQEPSRAPASAGQYPVKTWQLPTADIDTVDLARLNKNSLVVDVREAYRYRGEKEPIDLVAGHIPGAINIPYTANLDEDGRFRSPEVLREQYRLAVGDRNPKNLIVHCGSGVTACHTLLAMEVAGMPQPRLYVGSWSEWSRNKKPIAQTDTP